ncbi:hypothetical protein Tco_1135528 [Tanacetum coccineum]
MELVSKEKRLDIRKCNGRLNPGKIQREPTFQVVLDALALTQCYSAFLITADVPEVYMNQFWDFIYKHDTFYRIKLDKRKRFKLNLEVFRDIFKICPRVQGQDFDALPTDEKIVSFLRDLGHTGKSIHSMMLLIRCINPGELLLLSLTEVYLERQLVWTSFVSPEHKSFGIDNKAYKKQEKMYYPRFTKVIIHYFLTQDKTLFRRNKIRMHTSKDDYLINTLRFVSVKEETQIYCAILPDSLTSPEMKETKAYKTYLVSIEEPTGKSKRVKRPSKKTTKDPEKGVVIRETPKIPVSKKKEKVDTHPSGSGTVTKTAPSATKIKPSITSEGTGVKPGVLDVTKEESSESEAESWGYDEDDSKNEQESSGEENELKITDKAEGDEDEEMDYTTRNENPEILQVLKDAHVTLSTIPQKTEVPVTSSSHLSDLATKFLNFSDIPHIDAEIVSPIDVHVHHEVPSQQTPTLLTVPVLVISDSLPAFSTVIPQSLPSFTSPPQQSTPTPPPTTEATNPQSALPNFTSVFQFNNRFTALQKEVAELKKDPLCTQVTTLVDDHLDARLGATIYEFMNFFSGSLTIRITKQMVKESLEDTVLAKVSSQPQSSYEAAATLTEFELKKIIIDKMEKMYSLKRSQKDKAEDPSAGSDRGLKKSKTGKDGTPATGPKAKESQSGSSKGEKSQSKSFGKSVQLEEPEFEVADSDMPQDQEENLGNDDVEPNEKVKSKCDWFTKPTRPREPSNPDWNVDKTPQQGQNQSLLMTLASSDDKPSKTFD